MAFKTPCEISLRFRLFALCEMWRFSNTQQTQGALKEGNTNYLSDLKHQHFLKHQHEVEDRHTRVKIKLYNHQTLETNTANI